MTTNTLHNPRLTTLLDIVHRAPTPEPWAEGEKIPWNEPEFSARMLKEHLTQAHDAASRRFEKIDRHVQWIHNAVLHGTPSRILDLGCGPGLYASRLAKLGHTCTGIDFSPASIAYATSQAADGRLACTYIEGDIRKTEFGTGYDLAMLIYGEFNTFTREDAGHILTKVHRALVDGGRLVLEPHTFAAIRDIGKAPAGWYASNGGLWSARPHLCLTENFWDAERCVTTERYFIIDAETGDVTRHASSMQAYTNDDYVARLEACGFTGIKRYPPLMGKADASQTGLFTITAKVT